ITNAYRIALAAFDGGGDGFPADRRFDDVVDIANGQAITSSGFAVRFEIEKVAASRAFREGAAGVREIGKGFLDLHRDILNRAKIVAEDFDAQNGAEAGGEHFGAGLDRHP